MYKVKVDEQAKLIAELVDRLDKATKENEELKKSNEVILKEATDRKESQEALRLLKDALRSIIGYDFDQEIITKLRAEFRSELNALKTRLENYPIGKSEGGITEAQAIELLRHSPQFYSLADVDERINQRLTEIGPTQVVTVDVDQRIKELIKNKTLAGFVKKIQELPDPAKKAAWWLHEKKKANIKEVYNFVYDKTEMAGRIPGNFYANVINTLSDAGLIVNDNGTIRWTLQEKLTEMLPSPLSEEDLAKIPKYLISLLL